MPLDSNPREVLIRIIHHHVTEEAAKVSALTALMAMRDPPSEPPGAGWTTPDPKARPRRG